MCKGPDLPLPPFICSPWMLRQWSGCRQNPSVHAGWTHVLPRPVLKVQTRTGKLQGERLFHTHLSRYHFGALSECQEHIQVSKTDKAGDDPRQIVLPLGPREESCWALGQTGWAGAGMARDISPRCLGESNRPTCYKQDRHSRPRGWPALSRITKLQHQASRLSQVAVLPFPKSQSSRGKRG